MRVIRQLVRHPLWRLLRLRLWLLMAVPVAVVVMITPFTHHVATKMLVLLARRRRTWRPSVHGACTIHGYHGAASIAGQRARRRKRERIQRACGVVGVGMATTRRGIHACTVRLCPLEHQAAVRGCCHSATLCLHSGDILWVVQWRETGEALHRSSPEQHASTNTTTHLGCEMGVKHWSKLLLLHSGSD